MKRLLASCFGLGRLPGAPGTWGSLPVVIIFALMYHFGASPLLVTVVMAGFALVGFVVCIKCAPAEIAAAGKTDPQEVVADEFTGQAVTFLIIGLVSAGQIWAVAVLGFLLFRLFDIVKPWPIRKFERLPGGWGIVADALLARVSAGVILFFCLRTGFVDYLGGFFHFDGGSLNIFSAAVLGAIQGLTEFLPVSSSGHLVLFEYLLPGLDPDTPEMLLFDLSVHVATAAAILVVYRRSALALLGNLLKAGSYGRGPVEIYARSPSVRFLVLGAVATLVTFIMYKLFKTPLESARKLPLVTGMWFVTGTLLLVTDFRRKSRMGLRQFGLLAAVVVGLAQSAAMLPGISRSGATICTAILIGLHRRWAVEFSFLIAVPVILGAALLKFIEEFSRIDSAALPIGPVAVGMITAFLVGIVALRVLIHASRRRQLKFFGIYCYTLAALVIVYLLSGV